MEKINDIHTVIFASNNAGKIREISQLLTNEKIKIIPQAEYKIKEIEETGLTFIENAILKARSAARVSGLSAIADDSGLEVDVLHGAPGIYSARYAGSGATDQDNLLKLLDDLKNIPAVSRTARFHCVLVYLRYAWDPIPLICHGVWEGSILTEPRGNNGFGYDPVFFVPTHGCSSAELDPMIKNQLSHRGAALRQLQQVFK